MAGDQGTSKLHIDTDWKAEAQREKERLAKKEQARAPKPAATQPFAGSAKDTGPSSPAAAAGAEAADQASQAEQAGESHGAHELPEPSFRSLVGMLASQAVMGLGTMADPQTNRVIVDLEGSRFAIDLLDVLEQKTKGNLTDEEAKELSQILAELRSRFVQISNFVARQMAAQQAGAVQTPAASRPSAGPMPPLRQPQ